MTDFDGIYAALFSIYDENMKVKKESVKKLMKYDLDNGLKGFYVGGATGECLVLPNSTRKEMLETAMEYKNGSTIIAHVGAVHWDDTVELLKHADALGVDAVASLPPSLTAYYNEEETVNYYKRIAEISDKPQFAYIQAFYKGDIVKLAGRLLEIKTVAGIKLTVPDYYLFAKLRAAYPDMVLFNGPDESVLAGLAMGVNGAIGTTYNLAPKIISDLYEAFLKNDIETARKNQFKMNAIINTLVGNGMAAWKLPLEKLGIDPGYTVFPATIPDDEKKKEIFKKLEGLI